MNTQSTNLTINHRATLKTLRGKLALLKEFPKQNADEIARVASVVKTYERLYPEPKINCIDFTPR
jgi:hypothetical protein